MYAESYWVETASDLVITNAAPSVPIPFDTIISGSTENNWNVTTYEWDVLDATRSEDRFFVFNYNLKLDGLGGIAKGSSHDDVSIGFKSYYTFQPGPEQVTFFYDLPPKGFGSEQDLKNGETSWKSTLILKMNSGTGPEAIKTTMYYYSNASTPTPTLTVKAGSQLVCHTIF